MTSAPAGLAGAVTSGNEKCYGSCAKVVNALLEAAKKKESEVKGELEASSKALRLGRAGGGGSLRAGIGASIGGGGGRASDGRAGGGCSSNSGSSSAGGGLSFPFGPANSTAPWKVNADR